MNTDILFEEVLDAKNNKLGKIILNRPKALNAISYDMFVALHKKLREWEVDAAIKAVLIKSSSEKAFCAGGDIRAIYENKEKPVDDLVKYFELEYSVNRLIYHYSKPYISFLNGITMGGGVGVSIHGSHCVGTENLKFAMPETLIGFFPDIAASYTLSRLQDYAGLYLGLTGKTIGINDAYALDLIEYFVPANQLADLEKKLTETPFSSNDREIVSDIIGEYKRPVGSSEIEQYQHEIKHAFNYDTIEKIVAALQDGSGWSQHVAADLSLRSPTSLKVTLEQFKRASNMDFDAVSYMDLNLTHHFLQGHDFLEGIRAAVVDRDRDPKWRPASLQEISDADVSKYFDKTISK